MIILRTPAPAPAEFLARGVTLQVPLPELTLLVKLGRSGTESGRVCADSVVLSHYARLCGLRSDVTLRSGSRVYVGRSRKVGQVVGLREFSGRWWLFLAFSDSPILGAVIPGDPARAHRIEIIPPDPASPPPSLSPNVLHDGPPLVYNEVRDYSPHCAPVHVRVGGCEVPLFSAPLPPEWRVRVGDRVRVPLTKTVVEVAGVTPVSERRAVLLFLLNGAFGRLPLGCELGPVVDVAGGVAVEPEGSPMEEN